MVRLGRSEIHIGEFVDRDEAMLRLEQVTLRPSRLSQRK
jgi:hypothetical protein